MQCLLRFVSGLALVLAACLLQPHVSSAADAKSEFTSTTVDLGIVTSNVTKSVQFYTEAIGFKEVGAFSVSGDFGRDAGLTDDRPLDIRVLALSEDPAATRLKLMTVPGGNKPGDNAFIHSQLGYRYITIHVADADTALARLKKAGVKTLAKTPLPLPAGLPAGNVLIVVRDPDGNLVELVGPKR